MSAPADGSGASLAQKYQEKAQARKRGAGNREPKFRGFSLAKASDKDQPNGIPGTSEEGVTETVVMTTRTRSQVQTRESHRTTTIGLTTTTPNQTVPVNKTNGATSGLSEHFQGRIQARLRGTGSHQTGFRGFTIAAEPKSAEVQQSRRRSLRITPGAAASEPDTVVTAQPSTGKQPVASKSSSNRSQPKTDTRHDSIPTATTTTTTEKAAPSLSTSRTPALENNSLDRSSSRRRSQADQEEEPTPNNHDLVAPTKTSGKPKSSSRASEPVPQTPNSSKTRSASRLSGVSPSFKIAWGKNTTYLTTEPIQPPETTGSRLEAKPQPSITRKGRVARAPEPDLVEDSMMDMGDGPMNEDLDDNYREPTPPSPSPPREVSLPEEITRPAPRDTAPNNKSTKRKPDSTISSSRKPTASVSVNPVAKKRRLIREEEHEEEEADENEDPELAPRSKQAKEVNVSGSAKEPSSSTSRKSKDDSEKTKDKRSVSRGSKRVDENDSGNTGPATATKRGQKDPLRHTTLMQVASNNPKRMDETHNSKGKGASTSRTTEDVDSESSDSDFAKTSVRTARPNALSALSSAGISTKKKKSASTSSSADKRKGPSDQTVKTYKQLQIHCLKYWGPSVSVSRPAAVSNQEIAKQLPVLGERPAANTSAAGAAAAVAATAAMAPQKTVQSILQIDQAPLSEMDVIAEAVRDVVDKFIDQLQDRTMAKELLTLRAELESVLIEQVDMLDDHSVLRASVKKAAALKKELRSRLLETQRQRQRTRQELKRVRASFEREERSRRRLEETHKFLTDLESLRDEVVGSDPEDDTGATADDEEEENDPKNVKTGLQSLLATVGSRYAGDNGAKSMASSHRKDASAPGVLGALKEFNRLLESLEKSARDMPLVSHSQLATSTRTLGFDSSTAAGNDSSGDSDF